MTSASHGVHAIDCQYLLPRFAAAYLVKEKGRALFVDNNTARSVPLLLAELGRQGLAPEQVEYLVVTHVHLDHAGGTSALMRACPNARLLAHPRATRHLIDPAKLVASARRVYGDAEFERMYGEIGPIEAARVQAMEDGEELRFGSRTLRFLHTRGHANHHFCIQDSGSEGVFTGDAFGLCYPALQGQGLFIFPSTSPTDFDAPEARASIRRILETGAERAWLTHFGEVTRLPEAAAQLLEAIDFSESLLEEAARSGRPDDALTGLCEERLRSWFEAKIERRGLSVSREIREILKLDLELNAAGLAHVARKRRACPSGTL